MDLKDKTVINKKHVVQLGYQRVKEDGAEFCKPRWVGKLANGEFHEVSLEWVEENFTQEYINKMRGHLVTRAGNRLHHIPPGNCRKCYPKFHPNAPPIRYKQDRNEFCFVYALCNAVCYYFGNKKISNRLECFAKRMSQSLDCYEDIEKVIKQNMDGHIVDILCQPGGTEGVSIFDPLSEISNYVTLIVPQGKDGSCRHAVATVGRWAFESNQRYAQILSKDFLDWCVSTDEEDVEYTSTFYAMRIVPYPHTLQVGLDSISTTCSIHHSLSILFHHMGEVGLSELFKDIYDASSSNPIHGLFENKTGLFLTHPYLNGTEIRKEKVHNNTYSFKAKPIIQLIVARNAFACVMIGHWLYDVRHRFPIFVNENFFLNYKVILKRNIYLKRNSYIHNKFKQYLWEHPSVIYKT